MNQALTQTGKAERKAGRSDGQETQQRARTRGLAKDTRSRKNDEWESAKRLVWLLYLIMQIIDIETRSGPQCFRLRKGCQNSSTTTSLSYVWRLWGPRDIPSLGRVAHYLAAIIFIMKCRTDIRNQVAWPSVALSSTSHFIPFQNESLLQHVLKRSITCWF